MDENRRNSLRSAARYIAAGILRDWCILLIVVGFLAIPFGAFLGIEPDGPSGNITEIAKRKRTACAVMLGGGVVAITSATALYMADRRQSKK